MLGVGASEKTYLDDVFSTYVWEGNSTENRNINNGINLSGEGGMTWIKKRNGTDDNLIYDTVRGHNERLITNSNTDNAGLGQRLTGFNANGFKLGTNTQVNASSNDYASFTFRKAKGFCDVVTYSGQNSAQNISHSLGCVPGMIIVKKTTGSDAWAVWHRDLPNTSRSWLRLNTTDDQEEDSTIWGDTPPTASVFTVGWNGIVNENGHNYVAYLFGGGESTAATARSVVFDGNDHLSLAASDDFHLTGDFTLEWWCKRTSTPSAGPEGIMEIGAYNVAGGALIYCYNSKFYINHGGDQEFALSLPPRDQWCHYAIVRSGSTVSFYMNGVKQGQFTDSNDWGSSTNKTFKVASNYGTNFIGNISNVRLVKGTAVYTSSFRPPTEPLTSITNTVLLCCNNSSTTGKTTGGTITANGDPTASTDSPFDDPAGFKFGDSKEGIIKCGSYVGNGSATGPEINLGFEPSWILLKNATASSRDWKIVDAMRGIATGGDDASLRPNVSNAEDDESVIDLTPTGFKITASNAHYNENGETIIYCAIRRSDGYVGKPVELGTDVFNMVMGTSNSDIPTFVSGFVTDFATTKYTTTSQGWYTSARLTQGKYLFTNTADAESSDSHQQYDFNNGYLDSTSSFINYQAWMWKRHAGFDVVAYAGNDDSGSQAVPHSLSKTPEMIWVKCRVGSSSKDWKVYHKGLNGGTNPEQYHLVLNSNAAEVDSINIWNDTAPTSTHFTLKDNGDVNDTGKDYISMLFSSVDGISSVGSYDGSNSTLQITTGFQPRLVIIKRYTAAQGWVLVDSVNGDGKFFSLHGPEAVQTADLLDFNSTGFELTAGSAGGSVVKVNGSGESFIYYAHA